MELAAAPIALAALIPTTFGQCELQKLVPGDGQVQDLFGKSVAVSGDYAFVGQMGLSGQDESVYVYRRGLGGWVLSQTFVSVDGTPLDSYGQSGAMSGDTAVVSSPFHDHGSVSNSGAIYVYERTLAGWVEVQELAASDANTNDYLGLALDIDGDVIVSGSGGVDVLGLVNAGAAYVFERRPNGWIEVAKLVASDAAEHETFGRGPWIGARPAENPRRMGAHRKAPFDRRSDRRRLR